MDLNKKISRYAQTGQVFFTTALSSNPLQTLWIMRIWGQLHDVDHQHIFMQSFERLYCLGQAELKRLYRMVKGNPHLTGLMLNDPNYIESIRSNPPGFERRASECTGYPLLTVEKEEAAFFLSRANTDTTTTTEFKCDSALTPEDSLLQEDDFTYRQSRRP